MADSGKHFKVGSRKSQVVISVYSVVFCNIDFCMIPVFVVNQSPIVHASVGIGTVDDCPCTGCLS